MDALGLPERLDELHLKVVLGGEAFARANPPDGRRELYYNQQGFLILAPHRPDGRRNRRRGQRLRIPISFGPPRGKPRLRREDDP